MGAYLIIWENRTADEAFAPFTGLRPALMPFRDASMGLCLFNLTVLDCLRGLAKAHALGWVNFETFDVDEYEWFERVENGDWNIIIPGKLMCFAGPTSQSTRADGWRTLTPAEIVPDFKRLGVSCVVRLNKKCYDKRTFTDAGIKHCDLYYPDGTCPPESHARRWMEMIEAEQGMTAIHCKAGLGRAGTLTAMYAMKHYRFTAAEFIGYLRICRPGSIIGPQQHYLQENERKLWRQGEMYDKQMAAKAGGGGAAKVSRDPVDRLAARTDKLAVDRSTSDERQVEDLRTAQHGFTSGSQRSSPNRLSHSLAGTKTMAEANPRVRSGGDYSPSSSGPLSPTRAVGGGAARERTNYLGQARSGGTSTSTSMSGRAPAVSTTGESAFSRLSRPSGSSSRLFRATRPAAGATGRSGR